VAFWPPNPAKRRWWGWAALDHSKGLPRTYASGLSLFHHVNRKDQVTIDPAVLGILTNPGVVEYFSSNAHRMAACRALLDLLSIPLPDWATRDISGRAAARRNAIAAFRADNPETLHERTIRLNRGGARARSGNSAKTLG
jgi:hypothetical protein